MVASSTNPSYWEHFTNRLSRNLSNQTKWSINYLLKQKLAKMWSHRHQFDCSSTSKYESRDWYSHVSFRSVCGARDGEFSQWAVFSLSFLHDEHLKDRHNVKGIVLSFIYHVVPNLYIYKTNNNRILNRWTVALRFLNLTAYCPSRRICWRVNWQKMAALQYNTIITV